MRLLCTEDQVSILIRPIVVDDHLQIGDRSCARVHGRTCLPCPETLQARECVTVRA